MFFLFAFNQLVLGLDLDGEVLLTYFDGSSGLEAGWILKVQASLLELFAHFDGRFLFSGTV